MQTALLIAQIIVSILLAILILIQERGSGLGEGIAGVGGGAIQTKKRGAERVLAQATVGMIVLFLVLSLSLNFVQ
jgi:preprotein translocase subunit SecG